MAKQKRTIKAKMIPVSNSNCILVAANVYEGIHKKAEVLNEFVRGKDLVIEYRPKKASLRKNIGKCTLVLHDLKVDNLNYKVKVI